MGRSNIDRRAILRLGGAGLLVGLSSSSWAAPEGKPIAVRITNTSGPLVQTLEQLIKDLGYLEAFGVDAATSEVGDASKVMGALLGGSGDICMISGFAQVFAAIENGANVKIIGGAQTLGQQALFSKRPDILTVADLPGKTVGTGSPGSMFHAVIVALLVKKGVDIDKITFVNVGTAGDIFKAVVAGTVDAGPAQYDVYEDQNKYGVHSLKDADEWTELPEYTSMAVYAPERAIAEKREGLVRTMAAYAKMYRFLSTPASRDPWVEARKTALSDSSDEEALAQWRFIQTYQPYQVDITLPKDRIDYMQALNIKLGIQTSVLPFEKVADMSLAKEALQLLG